MFRRDATFRLRTTVTQQQPDTVVPIWNWSGMSSRTTPAPPVEGNYEKMLLKRFRRNIIILYATKNYYRPSRLQRRTIPSAVLGFRRESNNAGDSDHLC